MKLLSKEKKEELKQKRIEYTKNLSLEYQLGWYVGEYIYRRYLPTLSTDPLQTNIIIPVNEEDTKTINQLESVWFKNETDEAWKAYRKFDVYLQDKYLPAVLECHLSPLNIPNINEFKEGLSFMLWGCDCCSYDTTPSEIEITHDENGFFSLITLKLRLK